MTSKQLTSNDITTLWYGCGLNNIVKNIIMIIDDNISKDITLVTRDVIIDALEKVEGLFISSVYHVSKKKDLLDTLKIAENDHTSKQKDSTIIIVLSDLGSNDMDETIGKVKRVMDISSYETQRIIINPVARGRWWENTMYRLGMFTLDSYGIKMAIDWIKERLMKI